MRPWSGRICLYVSTIAFVKLTSPEPTAAGQALPSVAVTKPRLRRRLKTGLKGNLVRTSIAGAVCCVKLIADVLVTDLHAAFTKTCSKVTVGNGLDIQVLMSGPARLIRLLA